MSRGTLFRDVRCIGRFVVSVGSLYREVCNRYIKRLSISIGSFDQKVRYIGRFVLSGGSLYSADLCTVY